MLQSLTSYNLVWVGIFNCITDSLIKEMNIPVLPTVCRLFLSLSVDSCLLECKLWLVGLSSEMHHLHQEQPRLWSLFLEVCEWRMWWNEIPGVMAEIFHKWESISSSLYHPASICIIADIFDWIHFTQYQEVDHTLVVETWETWLLMTALASSLKVWKLSIFEMFIFTFIKLTICLVSDIARVCWCRENSEYEVITRIGGNKTETH